MTSEEYGERELLEELAQNVGDAFPRLMEAYYSQLYGLVMSLVRDPQSAEDVMQDSCIRIFQALKRYPETRIRALKLRAWLFQIVRNQALTFLEKKNKGNTLLIEDAEARILSDRAPLPEDMYEFREQVEKVRVVVEQLPAAYREVLTRYLFEELGYQEIAEQMGQSVNNVRTYASRGMRLLREKLAATID